MLRITILTAAALALTLGSASSVRADDWEDYWEDRRERIEDLREEQRDRYEDWRDRQREAREDYRDWLEDQPRWYRQGYGPTYYRPPTYYRTPTYYPAWQTGYSTYYSTPSYYRGYDSYRPGGFSVSRDTSMSP